MSHSINQTQHFSAKTNVGEWITLEWENVDPQSRSFSEKIKNLSEVLVQAYIPVDAISCKK